MDIWFDIYVTNGQNEQTFQIYNFFWIMHSFPIAGTERCKVYYIIPLNYQLIGHPENFKITL